MKTIDRKRNSEFTLGHIFVKHSGMTKYALIFSGLFTAVTAFGGYNYNQKPVSSTGTDFTPIVDSHNKLARISMNFCEHGDRVIENFYLGKSKDAPNHIYLYEQETVLPKNAPPSPTTWVRCKEPLDGCNELIGQSVDSDCDTVMAFFTRPIYTGHGVMGESAGSGCKAVSYSFHDHNGEINYDYGD
jgi:hypothetical protein